MCELEEVRFWQLARYRKEFPISLPNDLYSVIPGYSQHRLPDSRVPANSPLNSFFFLFPWIRHGFSFDLKTDSILVILVSILAQKALSWSQNKPAATVQWPKSLVCRDEDSGEQGSNSKRDHQGSEDHSAQSLSKASHLSWIQHRDSMMNHQNKESRNTDKASPQQWVFNRAKSSESSKKPGSPEQ